MHILIAPNAFKNSLDATAAAAALKEGIQQSGLNCTCTCFPVGDGGDGTGKLIGLRIGSRIIADVHDPLGRIISSQYYVTGDGNTAIIEMADASGLRLLKPHEYNPMRASSFGTGELVKAAIERGVKKIILAVGGTATVDGGLGILTALGVRFLDEAGNNLVNGGHPQPLVDIDTPVHKIVIPNIRRIEIIVLCDVNNRLLGEFGAAAIFGPQKGATTADIVRLEKLLRHFRDIVFTQTGNDIGILKHGGAAGGVAAGLAGLLNAKLVPGIDYFLDLLHFDEALKLADVVITGEGSIDRQTLEGKAPYGVALRAKQRRLEVIGVAGSIPQKEDRDLAKYFDLLLSINEHPFIMEEAIRNTEKNLQKTGRKIGDMLGERSCK